MVRQVPPAGGTVRIHAPAKINLSLEVTGKRPDGYHELVSIMQAISLHDTLEVGPSDHIEFSCSDPRLDGDDNLVVRAARLLRRRYGISPGCRLTLTKRIPVAAGLGGGSSDAAAALRALSCLWNLAVPQGEMVGMAAELGSDVPFFLVGGTALIEGRGEVVLPLPSPLPVWYLLVNPNVPVSTASIFSALSPAGWGSGDATAALAQEIGQERRPGFGPNSLQPVLLEREPRVRTCYDAVMRHAPGRTIIAGSGATVVSLMERRRDAIRTRDIMRALGYWSEVACALERHHTT